MVVYITKYILTSGAVKVPEGKFKIEEGLLYVRTPCFCLYKASEYVAASTEEEAQTLLRKAFEDALKVREKKLQKDLAKLQKQRGGEIPIAKPGAMVFSDVD